MESLPSAYEQQYMNDLFKMLVYCHRHNKEDAHLRNVPISFDVVRDPMYKYSRVAQEKFLKMPQFAFLYANFAKVAKKDDAINQHLCDRMKQEIQQLAREAEQTLESIAQR